MVNEKKIKILVIDGQGGKLGRQIIMSITEAISNVHITAVGTNAIATSNMIKAKVDVAVTGENAIIHNSKLADIIVGPIGIVVADSFYGEITPKMAEAIGLSHAYRVLLPMNKCNNIVVGIETITLTKLIELAVEEIKRLVN